MQPFSYTEPPSEYVTPDSTAHSLNNNNALYPNAFKDTQNYEHQHHLPKAINRPIITSNEQSNSRNEPQQTRMTPNISREENLPGSTACSNDSTNLFYDHTEQRMPHQSQKNNNQRIIQSLNQYTTPDQQTDVPFSSILDKHTAIFRQYALPDTTNPNNNANSNNPQDFHNKQRKESKAESKKSIGSVGSTSSHHTSKDGKSMTQDDQTIIEAPSEFSDVEHSPLSPTSVSYSNMRTMPVSHINLTERTLPTEYVSVPVRKISKQNKPKKKNTPPIVPIKPNPHAPAPLKYIPVTLDNPIANPEFLPKQKSKNSPSKKVTPPKRPPAPVEYVPIPVNRNTGQVVRPPKGARHLPPANIHPRNRTPADAPVFVTQPIESQRYVMHPSAPRLSYSSMEGWRSEGPSSFASIDPRKLRTQRVSPMLFIPTVSVYKPL